MWGAFACVCTCVCTCVRYLRYHASCFWRVWNLLSSEDWMVSEPLKAPQIHLSPSPSAEITSTLYTANHLKKQFTQVLVLMSQLLCQLRNHPNPMFLFVSLLTPALGSSSTPCRTNHLVTWLKCTPHFLLHLGTCSWKILCILPNTLTVGSSESWPMFFMMAQTAFCKARNHLLLIILF